VTRRIVAAFLETEVVEQLAGVAQHVRAAAEHHAVVFEREARHAEVGEQLFGFDQLGDAAAVLERFTRDRWVVQQLFLNQFAQMLVRRQVVGDVLLVRQFVDETAANLWPPDRTAGSKI